ncbi:major facilitator superfamily domain-containing protein [Trichoderma evansii]
MAGSPQESRHSLDLADDVNPVKFLSLSITKKIRIVATGIVIIVNSALGSSLPSGATSDIAKAFSLTNPLQLVLLNSLYMLGFAIGPLIFGPPSEHIGRKPVLISAYLGYVVFTLGCAVSPIYIALLLFRLLCGAAASAPNVVVGPLFADIYDQPEPRGRSMAYFMCATSMTPPIGPIISGYVTTVSWRLTFWIGLGIASIFLPLVVCLPETYYSIITRTHVPQIHNSEHRDNAMGAAEQKRRHNTQGIKTVFLKPFTMAIEEPVLLFTSLYLAMIYATLYLFFQAYPIIFRGVYGLSNGEVGLAFLPVTGGSFIALVVFLSYSSYHTSAMKAGATWATKIEYRRLPLACGGGAAPSMAISLFWLGWTSYPTIHPAVLALSGLFFGLGYLLIFMSLLNYITDAYRQFSASAHAAAATMRSITAVCLPPAAGPMYGKLGIQWACSLLAFVTLVLASIPFVFIRYGELLRMRSPFCQKLSTPTPSVAAV